MRTFGICILTALWSFTEVLSCNVILKPLVARPRPFTSDPARILLSRPEVIRFRLDIRRYPLLRVSRLVYEEEKQVWLFRAVICLIAFSRLAYLYVHYPTDVLPGLSLESSAGQPLQN